jgi:hypothetical protein
MTTNLYESGMDVRPTAAPREALGDMRDVPRGTSAALPSGATQGWTPAHSEAARFIGECFAVGALLGLLVEMARPTREQRDG